MVVYEDAGRDKKKAKDDRTSEVRSGALVQTFEIDVLLCLRLGLQIQILVVHGCTSSSYAALSRC